MANPEQAKAEPLRAIRLERNYRPMGSFEVVGWHRPEKRRKNAAGQEEIVQKAEFVRDEAAPPVIPGTGFADKVWKDTVILVPEAEARRLDSLGIGRLSLES